MKNLQNPLSIILLLELGLIKAISLAVDNIHSIYFPPMPTKELITKAHFSLVQKYSFQIS